MSKCKFVEEFYVVTRASVYKVGLQRKVNGDLLTKKNFYGKDIFLPTVEKIFHKEGVRFLDLNIYGRMVSESTFPVGFKLEDGELVSVGRNIIVYEPEYGCLAGGSAPFGTCETRIEEITSYGAEETSPVVALFLTKKDALDCIGSENLEVCDDRWIEQTKKVLEALKYHKVFKVCHYKEMALIQKKV